MRAKLWIECEDCEGTGEPPTGIGSFCNTCIGHGVFCNTCIGHGVLERWFELDHDSPTTPGRVRYFLTEIRQEDET